MCDIAALERLYEVQSQRRVELMYYMFHDLCYSDISEGELQALHFTDVLEVPRKYWSVRMHDMYGQIRVHHMIEQHLSVILGKDIKPLILDGGDPDQG